MRKRHLVIQLGGLAVMSFVALATPRSARALDGDCGFCSPPVDDCSALDNECGSECGGGSAMCDTSQQCGEPGNFKVICV
jgi:hypothetical protein